MIAKPYQARPIRFLEIYRHEDWQLKIYGISADGSNIRRENIVLAKERLPQWLSRSADYPLETYKVAVLMLHQGKEGCFAIINWWIDENMLQHFVYLATNDSPGAFTLFSGKGIITCVWELAVMWFERNAWVEHILKKH